MERRIVNLVKTAKNAEEGRIRSNQYVSTERKSFRIVWACQVQRISFRTKKENPSGVTPAYHKYWKRTAAHCSLSARPVITRSLRRGMLRGRKPWYRSRRRKPIKPRPQPRQWCRPGHDARSGAPTRSAAQASSARGGSA